VWCRGHRARAVDRTAKHGRGKGGGHRIGMWPNKLSPRSTASAVHGSYDDLLRIRTSMPCTIRYRTLARGMVNPRAAGGQARPLREAMASNAGSTEDGGYRGRTAWFSSSFPLPVPPDREPAKGDRTRREIGDLVRVDSAGPSTHRGRTYGSTTPSRRGVDGHRCYQIHSCVLDRAGATVTAAARSSPPTG